MVNQSWAYLSGKPSDSIQFQTSTVDIDQNLIVVGNTYVPWDDENYLISKYDKYGVLQWQKDFNYLSDSTDFGTAVVTDQNGDVYVTGATYDVGAGNFDYLTLMLDGKDGSLHWYAKHVGLGQDIPVGIVLDTSNNVYVTGSSEDPSSNSDYLTVKYDTQGQTLWSVRYDHAGEMELATGITIDSVGKITVTGGSAADSLHWDYATVQYDQNGLLSSEERTAAGMPGVDLPSAILADANGNIYITGSYTDTTGNRSIKTLRLDTGLQVNWMVTYDHNGLEESSSAMAVDGSGNVIIGGYHTNAQGEKGKLLIKYDADGVAQWVRSWEATEPCELLCLAVGETDAIYFSGTAKRNNQKDIITGQYSSDGILQWVRYFETQGGVEDVPTSIQVNATGKVFVTGMTATQGLPAYVLVQYEPFDRAIDVVEDTSGNPLYAANEVIIRFDPGVVDSTLVDNTDIQFATVQDWITNDTLINLIDETLQAGGQLEQWTMSRVFSHLTTQHTYSVSRLGDSVPVPSLWAGFVLQLPDNGTRSVWDEKGVANSLCADTLKPGVWYAETNSVGVPEYAPNDLEYDTAQLSLHPNIQFPNAHINVEGAWVIEQGKDFVKVGVYDSGLDYRHSELGGTFGGAKVAGGWDYFYGVPLDKTTQPDFVKGHGTAVAGIIGALRNNNNDIAGIAGGDVDSLGNTGATLYGMKIAEHAVFGPVSVINNAILEGAMQTPGLGYGLHIMNHSWSQSDSSAFLHEGIAFASQNQVVVVTSRGNVRGNDPIGELKYPACFKDHEVVNVTANGRDGQRKRDGNGDLSVDADNDLEVYIGGGVDVMAPGTSVLVQTLENDPHTFESTMGFGGTSSAAPHVAGVAALMLSYFNQPNTTSNNLSPEDVEHLLENTAQDRSAIIGYDDSTGWGLINATAALKQLERPKYRIEHRWPSTDTAQATLVQSNANLLLPPYQGLKAGQYVVDVYELTHTLQHNLGSNDSLLAAWVRPSSSYLWGPPIGNQVFPGTNIVMDSVDQSLAILSGYVYHILRDNQGQLVNKWFPHNLSIGTPMAYTLHVYDPTATSGIRPESMEREGDRMTIYPNPTKEMVHIRMVIQAPSNLQIAILDVNGNIVQTVCHGQFERGIQTFDVSLDRLANGIYAIMAKTDKGILIRKLVKIH